MKLRFKLGLILIMLTASANVAAQTDFDVFWAKFKAAVVKKDKNAVAVFVKYPFSMPYGYKDIKTKAAFVKSYDKVFNGEADAARCFPVVEAEKEGAKTRNVFCGFKETPDDAENTPLKYRFELTKTGWKLAGFDNINE